MSARKKVPVVESSVDQMAVCLVRLRPLFAAANQTWGGLVGPVMLASPYPHKIGVKACRSTQQQVRPRRKNLAIGIPRLTVPLIKCRLVMVCLVGILSSYQN